MLSISDGIILTSKWNTLTQADLTQDSSWNERRLRRKNQATKTEIIKEITARYKELVGRFVSLGDVESGTNELAEYAKQLFALELGYPRKAHELISHFNKLQVERQKGVQTITPGRQ